MEVSKTCMFELKSCNPATSVNVLENPAPGLLVHGRYL